MSSPLQAPATGISLAASQQSLSPTQRMLRRAWSQIAFKLGFFTIVLLVLAAFFYPDLSGIDPTKLNYRARLVPPIFFGEWSWANPLGTDQLGRDVLVRCLVGLRYSLLIGVITVAFMFLLGCGLGLVSGFKGGWMDVTIMRLTDAQLSIPMIILAISILGVSRPTIPAIILVLGLSSWPLYARVARSAALAERAKEYVRGERALGASDWRILLLFVAPVVLPPIAFVAVLDVARMMIFESILGFIGLGVQPPTPTFGNSIADGRKYLINAWWVATMPGLFLLIALTSLNLMGAAIETARNEVLKGSD